METQPTRLKFGAFLKSYLKQSLEVYKHPRQLLPTIILAVVWIVLGILQTKVKENLPLQVLNFITYAQGGLYGGIAGAIGGILGKVVVAAFVNALLVPLLQGKKPFNGLNGGFKELKEQISFKSKTALAPLFKGLGVAMLIYILFNVSGRFENSMAGLIAAVSLTLAIGKKSGFLWNFAFSYANSIAKGKTPDYQAFLRALTGMSLGFALGVALTAVGLHWKGLLVGIVFLVLGWILRRGTKKEAVAVLLLVTLTMAPASPAWAAPSGQDTTEDSQKQKKGLIEGDFVFEGNTIFEGKINLDMSKVNLFTLLSFYLRETHSRTTTTVLICLLGALLGGLLGAGAGSAAAAAAAGTGSIPPEGGDSEGPTGGSDPNAGKTPEEIEYEQKMKEYEQWKSRLEGKYTRKNEDGTMTVRDPATGETSTWYPKEVNGEPGWENENGTPYSDNDLANWLDDRERNSDYNRQNAATAESNLEDWRKRNEVLKDLDREEYNKKKEELAEQHRKEDRARRIQFKYGADSLDRKDLEKSIKQDIQESLEEVRKEESRVADYWDCWYKNTQRVQIAGDIAAAIVSVPMPGFGKFYTAAKAIGGRAAGQYSKTVDDEGEHHGGWSAMAKGALIGAAEAGVSIFIDSTTEGLSSSFFSRDTVFRVETGMGKQFISSTLDSVLDGKKPNEVMKDMARAGLFQTMGTAFNDAVKTGVEKTGFATVVDVDNRIGQTFGKTLYRTINSKNVNNYTEFYNNATSSLNTLSDYTSAAFNSGMEAGIATRDID